MKIRTETTILREILDSEGNFLNEIEIDIIADYRTGSPERGPSYDCGGTPEEPPSVEIVSAFYQKEEIELTEEEEEQVKEKILNDPPDYSDY